MCCPAQSMSPPILCLLSPLPWLCLRPGAPTCLPLLFCVWLYWPLFVRFRGLEGLGEYSWIQVGLLKGEGTQPMLLAEKGSQAPESPFSPPLVLAGVLAHRVKRSPVVPCCLMSP